MGDQGHVQGRAKPACGSERRSVVTLELDTVLEGVRVGLHYECLWGKQLCWCMCMRADLNDMASLSKLRPGETSTCYRSFSFCSSFCYFFCFFLFSSVQRDLLKR
jgi:hypothetical protein